MIRFSTPKRCFTLGTIWAASCCRPGDSGQWFARGAFALTGWAGVSILRDLQNLCGSKGLRPMGESLLAMYEEPQVDSAERQNTPARLHRLCPACGTNNRMQPALGESRAPWDIK